MSLTQATPRRDAVIALANGIRESLLAVTPTLIAEVDMRGGQELAPLGDGPTLAERAASINKHIEKALSADMSANRHRLRAGHELIEARKRVPHGEWIPWCGKNISRSMRDIQKLIQMAGSDDPEAALEQERADRRDGMREARSNTPHVGRISSPPIIEGECSDITPVSIEKVLPPGFLRPPSNEEVRVRYENSTQNVKAWLQAWAEMSRKEGDSAYALLLHLIAIGDLKCGRQKPTTPEPGNPAAALAAIGPYLNAMSDTDVREFGKMVTDYLIDRPALSAAT